MGKLIDLGSVPKDSSLFSGEWYFTSMRLSDVPEKGGAKKAAQKPDKPKTSAPPSGGRDILKKVPKLRKIKAGRGKGR
ncbi:hypothetical protein ACFL2P_02450 [Candidatus Moduliflexota bacterium]